jgi:hypothetical protein
MSQFRYIIIIPQVLSKFNLTYEEYAVIQSIHNLSTTSPKFNWCTASKDQISEFLQISRRTVFNAINKGLSLGLIEKNTENRNYLRTTELWTKEIYYEQDSAKNSYDSANFALNSAKNALYSANFAPYNKSINKVNLKNNIENYQIQSFYKEKSVEEIYPRLDKVVKNQTLICSRCQRKLVGKPIIRGGKKLCKICNLQDKELTKSRIKQEKKIKSISAETIKKIMENKQDIGKLPFDPQERTKIQEEIALQERRVKSKKP